MIAASPRAPSPPRAPRALLLASTLGLAAALVAPRRASAQAAPAAAPAGNATERRRLLEEARAAEQRGDFAAALETAQRAAALESSPALRWFMARQLRGLRRYTEAIDLADLCVQEVQRDSGSARTLEGCQQLAQEMRAQLGRFQFRFSRRPPAEMRLRANSVEVPRGLWEREWFVESATPIVIVAELPGGARVERRAEVFPGRTEVVRLELPADGAGPAAPGPGPGEGARGPGPGEGPGPVEPPPTRGPGVGPWVVAGVGGAVWLSTIAWFVLRNGAYDASLVGCDATGCPEANRADYDTAVTWNAVSNATWVAGPALVAGGVLWFLLAPRRPAASPAAAPAQAALRPSVGPGTIGLEGSF